MSILLIRTFLSSVETGFKGDQEKSSPGKGRGLMIPDIAKRDSGQLSHGGKWKGKELYVSV